MADEELMKMFNLTLKRRETILFFLIAVINGLTWIVSNIGLDTCVRGKVKGRGINHHALVFWTYFLKGKYDSNT